MLREKGPGVYLAVAERSDLMPDEFVQPATNWVLVSDLGLAAYQGTDGMAVDVRSLASGKPLPRVAVRLYARNNGELFLAASDAEGMARIPGGLLRGRGGDEAFVVTALGPDHDFNFLEIGRPAFDLGDRGVSGRPQPGPVDAFLYTDRGIYRPGETVELVTLVRDDKAEAMAGLPVSLRWLRPDGIEVEKTAAERRPAGRLPAELRPAARRPDRVVAGRAAARSEGAADRLRRIPRRGLCPAAAQSGVVRRGRADAARRSFPGRCRGALLLRRARSRAGNRSRSRHRAR